jgi:hypothetical protein
MTLYKTLIVISAALSALALAACGSMGPSTASTGASTNTSSSAPTGDPSMSGGAAPADQPPPKH